MAWTVGYWFDVDVSDMSVLTANNQAMTITGAVVVAEKREFQRSAGSTMTIAPGFSRAGSERVWKSLATRSVKVFYKPPGKPKNSAAVLPSKLSKSCALRPERVFSIEMVFGDVPSGCGKSLPIISRELPIRLTTSGRVESSEPNEK